MMKNKILCISFYQSESKGIGLLEKLSCKEDVEFVILHGLSSIAKRFFYIIFSGFNSKIVVINYVSLFVVFGFLLRAFGKKVVFVPHEGEPLFPKELKSNIKYPRKLIASLGLSKFCAKVATETLPLSMLQAQMLNIETDKVLRLGVKDDMFLNELERNGVFFPSRKSESIKGYLRIKKIHSMIINDSSNELTQTEMYKLYNSCRVVVIPSIVESYSFSMVESMLTNCIVVTSEKVGLAYDLMKLFSDDFLRKSGIYILPDGDCISDFVIKEYKNLIEQQPSTRKLALSLGLDGKSSLRIFESLL
ncbi:hypothetical protein NYG22_001000 [Vibrio alginolyticus]|nr:hypothetical protein [Vibrio alginolyticus]